MKKYSPANFAMEIICYADLYFESQFQVNFLWSVYDTVAVRKISLQFNKIHVIIELTHIYYSMQ